MAWDDCAVGAGASHDKDSPCLSNAGDYSLYCSFSLAQPLDQVVGLELVVDLQHADITLPDYWRLGPSPDCRHDLLTASLDYSQTSTCYEPAFVGAAVQDYLEGQPRGLASQARIKAVVFVPSPQTLSFADDTTYLAVRLVLSNDRTVSSGACSGCLSPACLVFNSILIRRTFGAVGGDVFVSMPAPDSGNWATWEGGAGANCSAVPVRARTWGAIKSLYR